MDAAIAKAKAADLPSPREVVRAYRTLKRLAWATHDIRIQDVSGSSAWDGIVEGRRMLAVTTAGLASYVDPAYEAAWHRMLNLPMDDSAKIEVNRG